MNESSYKKMKVEFQLAIVKELLNNNKIGIKEYEYVKEKLLKKLEKILIPDDLVQALVDIEI